MATHLKADLLLKLINAISESGWNSIVVDGSHPFRLRIYKDNVNAIDVCIYIWNCTHGGASRSAKEFRVQFTGAKPQVHVGELTVILGWHEGYEVFAAWGILNHNNQTGTSPSAQINEATLQAAHTKSFSTQLKANGEVVVAFRSEFLLDYFLTAPLLHQNGTTLADVAPLNEVESITQADIDAIKNPERKLVVSQIVKKFRAHDFRKRVLGAYEHRCAVCGTQLNLLEAAHVLPVYAVGSTDETCNGVALCKMHHAAFDKSLISFNENYQIEVSKFEVNKLTANGRIGGFTEFKKALKPMILLPTSKADQPSAVFITASRSIKRWVG